MRSATIDGAKFWMCLWCGRKTFTGQRGKIRHMPNCPNKVYGDSDGTGHRAFSVDVLKPRRETCKTCGRRNS